MSYQHIVSVSSGLGSAFAWKLVCDQYGPENVVGVFTDVNGEHPDNYRFLAATQYETGSRLIKLSNDGMTIWDVMIRERFLANTRIDTCSKYLKRETFLKWLRENADPQRAAIYLGIDWMESHRLDKARPYWAEAGFRVEAPLCEPPYRDKSDAQKWLDEAGIARPALYELGFEHANCGGGCVKAGVGQFINLLLLDRKWYMRWWEAGEERVRAHLGKNVSILRDRALRSILAELGLHQRDVERQVTGKRYNSATDALEPVYKYFIKSTGQQLPGVVPLTLRTLRERIDAGDTRYDRYRDDKGSGCGICFLEG